MRIGLHAAVQACLGRWFWDDDPEAVFDEAGRLRGLCVRRDPRKRLMVENHDAIRLVAGDADRQVVDDLVADFILRRERV